ncbi:GIY-YIG nuclease family protein [Naasia sp. SYSU D00057]|uniref:GIY-YIG nuclease family protein n=1 Tax=Naasia sp. SYSU D00057 TaxID=2817380 RepID=UPI001B31179A|nr:GIY-YIG nuclease family protein [Naasia sp. SYSU D00057]
MPGDPAQRTCALAATGVCRGAVPPDAPLDLCELHLVLAADWVHREDGMTDLLPSPCRLCGSRLGVRYPSGWLCAVCEWRVGEVLDDELPPPRVDVVYYLRYEDRVKIGTSSNPRQRLARIWHEEVLAFERGGRHLEQRRHAQFAGDRYTTSSEWFRLSPAIREHLERVTAGGVDPWDLYARWRSEAVALGG